MREVPDPDWPADLVALPCAVPAALWHWQRLERLLDEESESSVWKNARRAFHARWVLFLLARDDPGTGPLVSIVVPVFNRARFVCEALDSALALLLR